MHLLNADGYWMFDPEGARAWGFMLDHPAHTFARAYPAAWAAMGEAQEGQFTDAEGNLYVFSALSPSAAQPPRTWWLVLVTPAADIGALRAAEWSRVLKPGLPMLAALLFALALLSLYRHRQRRTLLWVMQGDAAIEATAEGIVITDHQGRILRANPAIAEITGRTESLVGHLTEDVLPIWGTPAHRAQVQDAIRQHGGWHAELPYDHPDGMQRILLVATAPIEHGQRAGYVATVSDITARKATERRLERHAHQDPLTRLANRRYLLERLASALALAQRNERDVAVLLLDLNGFKAINDRLGHATGDAVLCEVAQRLRKRLRRSDLAARLGGDEFVVMLADINQPDHASLVARGLGDRVSAPMMIDGRRLTVGVSIGIAVSRADESAEALLARADADMYAHKPAAHAKG